VNINSVASVPAFSVLRKIREKQKTSENALAPHHNLSRSSSSHSQLSLIRSNVEKVLEKNKNIQFYKQQQLLQIQKPPQQPQKQQVIIYIYVYI
jgi:hypothetical protein